jgi:flagellar operon protein
VRSYDVDFGAALERLQRSGQGQAQRRDQGPQPSDPAAFERALDRATRAVQGPSRQLDPGVAAPDIQVSRHATARLESRGIHLSDADLGELSDAVDKLAAKGARESLVLMDENAFIVGVPRRTVITALPRQDAAGSIFTNIDSTMIVR